MKQPSGAIWRQIPNAITIVRILSALPLLWLLVNRRFDLALALAFAAGVSDALDGLLAKRFGWATKLGSILDPLADKLLLTVAFGGLAWLGYLPWWLFVLVIGRDLLIVVGGVSYHYLIEPVEASPTLISKLNTAVQIALVMIVLVHLAVWPNLPSQVIAVGIAVVCATTIVSGVQYVVVWGGRALRNRK